MITVMLLLLILASIPVISALGHEYKTISLSFHAALNELPRQIHFHTEQTPGNIEPDTWHI